MLLEVELFSFAVDAAHNTPLVVLRQRGGDRTVAIPIGSHEAGGIALESLNVKTELPRTIDLVATVVAALGGKLQRILFNRNDTGGFVAWLQVCGESSVHLLECCVGDALALALRGGVPMLAYESVFQTQESNQAPGEELRRFIAGLDTLAFGCCHLE